jgi:hypothetical protein
MHPALAQFLKASLLRHSRIQTTLNLYTQGDVDETQLPEGAFLRGMGLVSKVAQ